MSSHHLKYTNNFELKEFIDSGNFATVYKIAVHEDQKEYAVKQINLNKFEEKEKLSALHDARMEYLLLKKGIPNVLRSFGSFHDPKAGVFKFSTEYMEMNLDQYIKAKGSLTFNEFIPLFTDILTGIVSSQFFPPHNFIMTF